MLLILRLMSQSPLKGKLSLNLMSVKDGFPFELDTNAISLEGIQ